MNGRPSGPRDEQRRTAASFVPVQQGQESRCEMIDLPEKVFVWSRVRELGPPASWSRQWHRIRISHFRESWHELAPPVPRYL